MGTTGLVIAAGCIGATLLVVTVTFGIYVMRTKGLTFSNVFRRRAKPRHRIDRTYDVAKPTVYRMPAYAWDERKPPPSYSQSVPLRLPEPVTTRFTPAASQSGVFTEPASRYTPAASRGGLLTEASSRYTPNACQSGLLKPTSRPSTPPGFKSPSNTSFLDDSTPPRNSSRQSNHSREPSSPITLPLQQQRNRFSNVSDLTIPPLLVQSQDPPRENSFYRSRESSINLSSDNSLARTRRNSDAHSRSRDSSLARQNQINTSNTSFITDDDDDDDDDNDDDKYTETLTSPHIPLPSFQHFMANRPGPPPSSRARAMTQTSQRSGTSNTSSPVDASFGVDYRESTISTTSVSRFRSVDSWVGQQTSRIEITDLRDQPQFSFARRNTAGGGLGQVDEGLAGWGEEVPDVPGDGGAGGGTGHRRQNTNHSDATVFRVHPGCEIKILRSSLVPSEILDANMVPSVL